MAAVLAALALSVAPLQYAEAGEGLAPQTLKELAQVRRATAKYHDISNALADGYVDVGFVAPGVGCHMLNPIYASDGFIDLNKPELLVYSDCSGTALGQSELRAVEYSLICSMPGCVGTTIPEGFTGDHDAWELFPGAGMIPPQWTLHAWVWRHNPDGIFVTVNPAVD
jgi:hypothetical protein